MRQYVKLLLAFVLLIIGIGCEGPKGPQGPAGPQGPQGESGPGCTSYITETPLEWDNASWGPFSEIDKDNPPSISVYISLDNSLYAEIDFFDLDEPAWAFDYETQKLYLSNCKGYYVMVVFCPSS